MCLVIPAATAAIGGYFGTLRGSWGVELSYQGGWGAAAGGALGLLAAWIIEPLRDSKFHERPRRVAAWIVIGVGSLVLAMPCLFILLLVIAKFVS